MKKLDFDIGQFNFLDERTYESVVKDVVDSGWYTNHGPQAQALETELAELLGVQHVVLVSNATLGLSMAIEAVDRARRIVMPALSFPATLWSAQFAKLPVILVDIELATGHVDVGALREIAREGDLFVIPNLYGGAARISEISEVAKRNSCRIIFDSAGSLGTRFEGKMLGRYGDCEVFSLHATKIVGAGEGGFVATNDEAIAARLRSIRSSYGNPTPVPVDRTANARISEVQAGCARRALPRLTEFISHNKRVMAVYLEKLVYPGHLRPIEVSPGVTSNGSSCTFMLSGNTTIGSENLVERLRRRGIRARRYHSPGLHQLSSSNRLQLEVTGVRNTNALLERVFQLPVGGRVSDEDAQVIADNVLLELVGYD